MNPTDGLGTGGGCDRGGRLGSYTDSTPYSLTWESGGSEVPWTEPPTSSVPCCTTHSPSQVHGPKRLPLPQPSHLHPTSWKEEKETGHFPLRGAHTTSGVLLAKTVSQSHLAMMRLGKEAFILGNLVPSDNWRCHYEGRGTEWTLGATSSLFKNE